MKGNNGLGNIPGRDLWQTPKVLMNNLNAQYKFTFDCCADDINKKCELFSSDLENATIPPNNVCWMNPPFSKAKDMFNIFFKKANSGVAIYRCDNMETSVWQDVILKNADWVFLIKGRTNYEGFGGGSARFPSALIGFNVSKPVNMKGVCLNVPNKM